MDPADADSLDLTAVAATHRRLLQLAVATDAAGDVQAILNLGAAVLLHAALEPAHLARVLRLVDPAVRETMLEQHRELEHDLAFLQELATEQPGSDDAALLAGAVLQRLRRHLERDQRALYGPLARLHDLDRSGEPQRSTEPDTGPSPEPDPGRATSSDGR